MFTSIFNDIIQSVTDKFYYYFNTEFWSLVGYTGVAVVGALLVARFFPALRSFCGAVVLALAAMWYGYHKGQQSDEPKVEVKPAPKRDEWNWNA